MTTLTADKARAQGKTPTGAALRNERLSLWARAKRPLPATRAEADETFAPASRNARVKATRLERLSQLGCLRIDPTAGRPITQGEAHEAILDAMYDPVTGLLRDVLADEPSV